VKRYRKRNGEENSEGEVEVEKEERSGDKASKQVESDRKVEVLENIKCWTFRYKLIKRISRRGNEVLFVRFSQGRRVNDRVLGGRIDIPLFKFDAFIDDIRVVYDKVSSRLSESQLRRIRLILQEMLNITEQLLTK